MCAYLVVGLGRILIQQWGCMCLFAFYISGSPSIPLLPVKVWGQLLLNQSQSLNDFYPPQTIQSCVCMRSFRSHMAKKSIDLAQNMEDSPHRALELGWHCKTIFASEASQGQTETVHPPRPPSFLFCTQLLAPVVASTLIGHRHQHAYDPSGPLTDLTITPLDKWLMLRSSSSMTGARYVGTSVPTFRNRQAQRSHVTTGLEQVQFPRCRNPHQLQPPFGFFQATLKSQKKEYRSLMHVIP